MGDRAVMGSEENPHLRTLKDYLHPTYVSSPCIVSREGERGRG